MIIQGGGWSVRRITRLGMLAAVGTALFVLESFIPLPVPFLKIGLANVSTLLALATFGPADALIVVAFRILAGSLVTGSFLGPSFVLASAAGLSSAAAMILVRSVPGSPFGLIGVSLAGAFTHVLTQLAIVALVYVRNPAVLYLLPLLLCTALVGGIVVGTIALRLLPALVQAGELMEGHTRRSPTRFTLFDKMAILGMTVAVAGSFIIVGAGDSRGRTVLVQVDGQTRGKLDLRQNASLSVNGTRGMVSVEVFEGRVRVSAAECPNKICVRTGWRSRSGDVIVCVPNKTIVRILGGESDDVKGVTG